MEGKAKINSDKNNHIIAKKIYQNPFKKDIIYKSNKIKLKKISMANKDNLLMNSNTIKKLSHISTERNIINQGLKKDMTTNYFSSNISIFILNKTEKELKKILKVKFTMEILLMAKCREKENILLATEINMKEIFTTINLMEKEK
jgi:hypothetical protein